jgi:hypothetical protein
VLIERDRRRPSLTMRAQPRQCARILDGGPTTVISGSCRWRSDCSVPGMPFAPRQTRSSDTDFARIRTVEFSPLVADFIARYEAVAHRDAFLWRWAHVGIELTTLPSAMASLRGFNRDSKLLAVILNVLLDDLADRDGVGVGDRLDAALDLVEGRGADTELDDPYLTLIGDLWRELDARAKVLPGYADHAALLSFDQRQVVGAGVRYAHR